MACQFVILLKLNMLLQVNPVEATLATSCPDFFKTNNLGPEEGDSFSFWARARRKIVLTFLRERWLKELRMCELSIGTRSARDLFEEKGARRG